MSDSYKIIISVSHHRISFEYYLEGGDDVLAPMPPGHWPAPLAFYCSPTGIVIGEEAARAAQSGTANAFNNYFDLLPQQDVFYEIGGERKPIRKMLLDASETLFREFYSSVMLNRSGNLNDNRLSMPLTIVCEADIKDNERVYVKETFRDSGYGRVKVVNYDKYINRYIRETLSKEYDCDKVLVVWSESSDLTLTLFDASEGIEPVSKSFIGLGVDPRLNFVMNKIWEHVVAVNPYADFDIEQSIVKKAAIAFLNSSKPLVRDDILLSDGVRYPYSLLRSNVDFDIIHKPEALALRKGVEAFLSENFVTDKSRVLLLLRGDAAGNRYFENNLNSGFSNVIRSDRDLRLRTMRLIVSSEIPPVVVPPVVDPGPPTAVDSGAERVPSSRDKREFRLLKAEVGTMVGNNRQAEALAAIDAFAATMHTRGINAFDAELQALNDFVHQSGNPQSAPSAPEVTSDQPESGLPVGVQPDRTDNRHFRETKAQAKTSYDSGNPAKAQKLLLDFKKEMNGRGIVAFDEEIDRLVAQYSAKNPQVGPLQPVRGVDTGTTKGASATARTVTQGKEPTARDRRDFSVMRKVVDSMIGRGDVAAAKKEVGEFEASMHAKGIKAFDADLAKIKDKIRNHKK